MPENYHLIIMAIVCVALWTFIIISTKRRNEKKKKTDKIISIIMTSNITSLRKISSISGLRFEEVQTLIEKMIENANFRSREYVVFKNAHIDYSKGEVVLDVHANDTKWDKIGDSVNSVLDRFAPRKEVKRNWSCSYCKSTNVPEVCSCTKCGAGRTSE